MAIFEIRNLINETVSICVEIQIIDLIRYLTLEIKKADKAPLPNYLIRTQR